MRRKSRIGILFALVLPKRQTISIINFTPQIPYLTPIWAIQKNKKPI